VYFFQILYFSQGLSLRGATIVRIILFSKQRLDRAVANLNLGGNFKDVDVRLMAAINFDHCQLLINY